MPAIVPLPGSPPVCSGTGPPEVPLPRAGRGLPPAVLLALQSQQLPGDQQPTPGRRPGAAATARVRAEHVNGLDDRDLAPSLILRTQQQTQSRQPRLSTCTLRGPSTHSPGTQGCWAACLAQARPQRSSLCGRQTSWVRFFLCFRINTASPEPTRLDSLAQSLHRAGLPRAHQSTGERPCRWSSAHSHCDWELEVML